MVAKVIRIKASDGHSLDGYLATPPGVPRAGLLVLQEVFGLTPHIRQVTEGFARQGFLALAPALFDRLGPGTQLPYTEVQAGVALMQKLPLPQVALDLTGALAELHTRLPAGTRVGAVGYCWGGAIADLAACRTKVDAAVCYYGRANVNWLTESPGCPVLYHFGAEDPLIPPATVAQIQAGRPASQVWVYPGAGHGFSCDERSEFHPASAALAEERTLSFFARHLLLQDS